MRRAAGASRRRRWTWRFDQPPERIWPALADTARFNEAAELPKHSIEESPQPDGTVIYTGRAKMGPMTLAWQDLPVEWVTNRSFKHCRKFHNGPFASLCATLALAREGEGCRADYDLEVAPANALGRLLLEAAVTVVVIQNVLERVAGFADWISGTVGRLARRDRSGVAVAGFNRFFELLFELFGR